MGRVALLGCALLTACATGAGPSPTPTAPPTSTPDPVAHAVSCTAALPQSWRAAITAGLIAAGPEPERPVHARAIDPAGTVLLVAGDALQLVGPSGARRTIYRLPGPSAGLGPVRVGAAALDARWVVFGLIVGGGQGSVGAIDAVDRRTGRLRVLRHVQGQPDRILTGPVLARGAVYWSETDKEGDGAVYRVELASGRRARVDTGIVLGVQAAAGGVFWTRDARIVWGWRPQLPAGVAPVPGKVLDLVSDGTGYALGWWHDRGGTQVWTIRLWVTRGARPVTVYTSGDEEVAVPAALAGPFLIWDGASGSTVLDTRSGATASLPTHFTGDHSVLAGGGRLAINLDEDGGRVSIVALDHLAALRC